VNSPNPTGIVVAGEALIDLVPGSAAGGYVAKPGGGPANAAVALARLGLRSLFLGRLSRDGFGNQLAAWLAGNGVDLSLTVRADQPTTLAVAAVDEDGSADYTFYWRDTANWEWSAEELPSALPTGVVALHVGSLATVMQPGADLLDDLLRRCDGVVTTFVDPNFRSAVDTRTAAAVRLSGWVEHCDIVKVSVDDLAFAFPDHDPHQLVRDLSVGGRALMVLTDGPRGAHAYADGAHLRAQVDARKVVDTIGAGDTFGAALLYALGELGVLHVGVSRPLPAIEAALEFACAAAAVTCGRAGADSPTRAELPAIQLRQ
jgi:fructokinase